MTLLIDIGPVPEAHCNDCLEDLFKALAVDPLADEATIWDHHQNPYLTALVEEMTLRFQSILQAMQGAMSRWLFGDTVEHALEKALGDEPVSPEEWLRWTPEEKAAVEARLASLQEGEISLDDWLLGSELLVQTYLPDNVIKTQADYMTVKAALLGKIQATLAEQSAEAIAKATSNLPPKVEEVPAKVLTPVERKTIEFAQARAATRIRGVADVARARMKSIIIDKVEAQVMGDPRGNAQQLRQELFDNFGQLNRDFRRIAITEAGEACNQGFVAAMPEGDRVERREAYRGACEFCKSINGKSFLVVAASDPNRDGQTQVWPGKTNEGRSASPRKRVGKVLMERGLSERWWPAAGVQHPHCFIDGNLPVYTSSGWKPISTIALGDLVLTHLGRFMPVTWVLADTFHTGQVFGAVTKFEGRNKARLPASTGEHPIRTERGWVPSSELVSGDRLIALAKICPTCTHPFVNLKFPNVRYCSLGCVERAGINQFSTDDPAALAAAKAITGEANTRRLRGMTVEQRAALTAPARAIMRERGYAHLLDPASRRRGAKTLGANNYQPSETEIQIAEALVGMGCQPLLQHRVEQIRENRLGKKRHWWLDLAIPDQRIAIEIDGEPWHGRMANGRDDVRDADLQEQGWTVLRFDAKRAASDPYAIAAEIARIAMNHDGAYVFGSVEVVEPTSRWVKNRRLYNFAVDEDESYVVGGGYVVHNCRGSWTRLSAKPPEVSQEFEDFLHRTFAEMYPLLATKPAERTPE
jgi:very-short-patch-repair endonuclease